MPLITNRTRGPTLVASASQAETGFSRLRARLFNEDDSSAQGPWRPHALGWFDRPVVDANGVRFPVIEVDGSIVATAIGTLEVGVPNPQCLRGRTVRLANVLSVQEYRGRGYGTRLVLDVISWVRLIAADRVDLSATRGFSAST